MTSANSRCRHDQELCARCHIYIKGCDHFIRILRNNRTVQMSIGPQFGNQRRLIRVKRAPYTRECNDKIVINRIHYNSGIFRTAGCGIVKAFRGADFFRRGVQIRSFIHNHRHVPRPHSDCRRARGLCAMYVVLAARADDHVTLIHQRLRLVLRPRCRDHLNQCRIFANFGEFRMDVFQKQLATGNALGRWGHNNRIAAF